MAWFLRAQTLEMTVWGDPDLLLLTVTFGKLSDFFLFFIIELYT